MNIDVRCKLIYEESSTHHLPIQYLDNDAAMEKAGFKLQIWINDDIFVYANGEAHIIVKRDDFIQFLNKCEVMMPNDSIISMMKRMWGYNITVLSQRVNFVEKAFEMPEQWELNLDKIEGKTFSEKISEFNF